jgi:hypothetical protein
MNFRFISANSTPAVGTGHGDGHVRLPILQPEVTPD